MSDTTKLTEAADSGLRLTACSASEFHRRYKKWATSDPIAKRLDAKRLRAKKNRQRRNLPARRKNYWGRVQITMESRLMRKFHSLPNVKAHSPQPDNETVSETRAANHPQSSIPSGAGVDVAQLVR